jgi:Ras GTPase-activating-like protein IQGAP2/3
VTLCKLGNVFCPQAIGKIHITKTGSVLEFMAVDNISKFMRACTQVDFPRIFMFEVTDLWEKKNIYKVVHCIHTLANFLNQRGKAIKIKNLSKAGLVFDADEIQRTKDELKKLDDLGISDAITISTPRGDYGEDDDTSTLYDSGDDDALLDEKSMLDDDDLADPDMCGIEGEAKDVAIAGQENKFTIVARDVNKKDITHGGETFEVDLYMKNSDIKIKGTVTDLDNGKYSVVYKPEVAGEYEMEIKLIDTEGVSEDEKPEEFLLKGCPMRVNVMSSPTSDPSKCNMEGVGLSAATAGVENKFTLESRDIYGNRGRGGEDFRATLSQTNGDTVNAVVNDKKDGLYEFVYTCPRSGEYELQVYLGDAKVGESKIVQVKDAGISDPSKTEISGLSELKEIIVGEKYQFVIIGKDKHGNSRSSGGEKFTVVLNNTDGASVTANVVDLNDGTYSVDFVAEKSGNYDLTVSLATDVVVTEPIVCKSTGITDPSLCSVACDEDYKNMKAGEHRKLIVSSRDKYGNKVEKSGDLYTLHLISKTTIENVPEELIKFTDLGDGTYEIDYELHEASEYAMQLLLKVDDNLFENLTGFPCDIIVSDAGVSSASNTVLEGEGLGTVILNDPSKFSIISHDKFNNKRKTGGDKVEAKLINNHSKIELNAEVTDLEDGTYEVNYVPSAVGDYQIHITINGDLVPSNTPIRVNPKLPSELSNEELEVIHDHDLLSSLLSSFSLRQDNENLISEINATREKLIRQIRDNNSTEQHIKELERKIQLLIQNRLKIEEVLGSKSRFGRRRKIKAQAENTGDDDERKTKLDSYSNLFYLLQTDPKYLSQTLYLVPNDKMDKFLETVILTLYGYAFSPREEYLILNLFRITLQLEISQSERLGSFLNNNPVLPKMVMNYGRRLQGKQFLQKVLFDKIISNVLNERDLNLELNAVKIFKEHISKQEVETGVKSGISMKDVTPKKAMEDDFVRKTVEERVKKLTEICQSILDGIIDNVHELPYGLRWVCKQLDVMLTAKHPESTDVERASIIGYIAYYRFMNPPICAPDAFQLTKKKISLNMRNNLVVISKVLTNLTNNILFDARLEDQMTVMNDWIQKNQQVYVQGFIQSLISVKDPEETLGVHKYMELTQKKAPSINITWNEIFSTHQLLKTYVNKLAPEDKDPLKILINRLGDVSEELPAERNEEITLPLVNGFTKAVDSNEQDSPDHLYDETKENFRTILRHLPPDSLGDSVVDTLESAKKHATLLMKQNASQKEICQTILSKVEAIEKALPKLEETKILTKQNRYRKLLVDITKEIQNERDIKEKQKNELARLTESLQSLEDHHKFLGEKIDGLQEYIEDTRRKHYEDGAKRSGKRKTKKKESFKFSYKQLAEKHKVIEDLPVMKNQRSLIKFQITMTEPGRFEVDAQLAGKTMHTIKIDLEELLDKQSKTQETVEIDGVKLNVNMTLHMLNKLFSSK